MGTVIGTRQARTQAERLFEKYLAAAGYRDWDFEPDIPGQSRHPDYRVRFAGAELLFEVKELHEKRPWPDQVAAVDPYQSLRQEIEEGRRKFKGLKGWSCSLVVHNVGDWTASLDPLHVFGAMLGDVGFTMAFDLRKGRLVHGSERPAFLDRGKMIRPKKAEAQNRTISSIIVLQHFLARDTDHLRAVMAQVRAEEMRRGIQATRMQRAVACVARSISTSHKDRRVPRVIVVENPFARTPLPRSMFVGPFDERWALESNRPLRVWAGPSILDIEHAEREAYPESSGES